MRRLAVALLFLASTSIFAANGLRIVSAGPVGEVATLAEANEVRVVFSEPMVTLGRIPTPVTAPFFRIEPAVKGTFRWSGTTTLIFTPERPLPFATQYTVTIDPSAKSVSGKTLDQPYRWTFTTPTIRLVMADWYRKNGKADAPVVIGLRFNQPIDPNTIVQHLQLRTQAHDAEISPIPAADRLTPAEVKAFEAKRAKAEAAASSDDQPVFVFVAKEWNKERFAPGKDLVVLETRPGVAPDTWIKVLIDEKIAASERHARAGREQAFTLQLDRTFFVSGIECQEQCDPEYRNWINFTTTVPFANVRKALTVTDITDRAKPVVLKPKTVTSTYEYPSSNYGLDELGYSLQPARTYEVRIDPGLTADDGQKLGYTWVATVENWHKSAFVSFGSGYGVWESSGGSILPFHARNYKSVKQWLAPLKLDELMPVMLRMRESGFNLAPPSAKPQTRTLNLPVDRIGAVGLDLKPAIGEDNIGFAWAAVQPGQAIPRARTYDPNIIATLVQVTNLGISVKDSPLNTVIMVTRLDDGKRVEGANVSIRNRANKIVWSGMTDANGIAVAPNTDLRRATIGKDVQDWEVSWR
ncbi:MAG TPA: Ig-like domain-containing protein, partial [Vicinamibacterales bacterium]|nr:Ig-like domain-containing protein [Vicinamibacterales bacterium]